MRILQIVFLLNVCGCLQVLSLAISDILEIVKLSKDVTFDLFKTFALVDEDVGLSPKVKGQSILFREIKVFKNKIDMLSAQMGIGWQILYVMVGYTDIQFELKLKLMEVIKNIDFIKLKYKNMGTFIESNLSYEDLTLEEFARSVVSDSNSSIESYLDRIDAIIAPEEDESYEEDEDYDVEGVPSVFKILHKLMKEQGNELFCNMHMSEQQLVLYLYNTLALTELKGFLLMEFSYMLLKLQNKGNFSKAMEATQKRYKDRHTATLKMFIEAVTWANYDLWKCDPYKQVKYETYIEITQLLQGYIENEENLNPWRSCLFICTDFDNEVNKIEIDKNRQCKGKIINCNFMADATVCLAEAGTNRRYEYINQAEKMLGRYKDCAYKSTRIEKYIHWFNCDYCMCLCDEQGVNSDRYFNLRSSESEIDHNMVVTGLRFVKKNRIIHLQIQQGKLLPMGKIDVTTIRWKPVEDYRIDDHKVRDGQDYHTLTWDKRNFDLDNLVTKEEELLTGVRFGMVGSHLQLQIRVTPFNFTTGTLLVGISLWKFNGILDSRKKVNLDNKDIPIMSPGHSLPLSQNGMYLEFTPSDLDMDAAQTTVPFIDAQAVASAKPVPLCGAGVMYKGSKNFGGFIYPKIMMYNYSRVLRDAYDDNIYFYL